MIINESKHHKKVNEQMISKSEYMRRCKDYVKRYIDLEDDETPEDWLNAFWDALKEEGSIVNNKVDISELNGMIK